MGYSIEDIVDNLKRIRDEKAALEKKEKTYKTKLTKYMKKRGLRNISGHEYCLSLNSVSREIVTKKNLPRDIWNRYSSTIHYDNITLRKKRACGKKKK